MPVEIGYAQLAIAELMLEYVDSITLAFATTFSLVAIGIIIGYFRKASKF